MMEYSSHATKMVSTGIGTVRQHRSPSIFNHIKTCSDLLVDYPDRVAEMEMSTGVAAALISTMF